MSVWAVYEPTSAQPWNKRRVVHLHRRCVFGPSWPEIQRDLADDPQAAVSRVLQGGCRIQDADGEFERLSELIGRAAIDSGNPDRLKAWWVYRMLMTGHPLEERLTLMWHNHFATSNLKVNDLEQMHVQNSLLRDNALVPFSDLLRAVARDPAMLLWLDAPTNRKGHANENFARELMELFTLGVGNYTETDVKEAARALTGWSVRNRKFYVSETAHDDGIKTVLGKSGHWDENGLLDILLQQPDTSRRIAWRLADEFFGEGVVGDADIDELANGLRDHELSIRWGVETILRSQMFFSDANIGSWICDPVTYLLAPLRGSEAWRDPPSTLVLAAWLTRFGLDLFYPPNVGGWKGGRDWMNTRTNIARTNFAEALVSGQLSSDGRPPPFAEAIPSDIEAKGIDASIRFWAELLFGSAEGVVNEETRKTVLAEPQSTQLNRAISKLLTLPRAHIH